MRACACACMREREKVFVFFLSNSSTSAKKKIINKIVSYAHTLLSLLTFFFSLFYTLTRLGAAGGGRFRIILKWRHFEIQGFSFFFNNVKCWAIIFLFLNARHNLRALKCKFFPFFLFSSSSLVKVLIEFLALSNTEQR